MEERVKRNYSLLRTDTSLGPGLEICFNENGFGRNIEDPSQSTQNNQIKSTQDLTVYLIIAKGIEIIISIICSNTFFLMLNRSRATLFHYQTIKFSD